VGNLPDPYAMLQESVLETLLLFEGTFTSIGMALFRSFAIILLAWFGIQTALGAGDRGGPFPMAAFARLLLLLAIGYAMVTFYQAPIPGLGYTLPGLVMEQATWLVGRLHTSMIVELLQTIDDLWTNVESPGLMDLAGALVYVTFGVLCGLMKFAVFFVISFGYIATAVLVVLGPLFIPFFIVPGLDFLFWSWLRAFFTYAFYQVVAEVYVAIWASFLLRFLGPFRAGFDLQFLLAMFTFILMILLAFVFGMLKIPSLTASIFAGRGGEGTAGETIAAFRAAGKAVTRAIS
jgi:hypothetical protein